MAEFTDLTAGSADLLTWRRRARAAVTATHLAGVLALGALEGFTEGPAAPFAGTPALALAWLAIAAITAACAVQFAALAVCRRRGAAVRAAAGPSRRHGRLMLKGCAALLILAAWTAEAGYAVQAVSAVRSGGWDEPVSNLGAGLDAWALLGSAFTLAVTIAALILGFPARFLARNLRRTTPRHR
jgi:hypothetical protein